jgi:Na+-driven multidrug efflux pump
VRFSVRHICLSRRCVREILRIGIPSALQSSLFSLSNILIQSGVNTFPTTTVSGATVGSSIEGITYTAMHSFYQATLTFTGQNHGAGKNDRVWRVLLFGGIQVTVVGLLLGYVCIFFSQPLSALFIDTSLVGADAVIAAAAERIRIVLSFYFICGLQEVLVGHLRGKGYSLFPMLTTLLFVCVFRVAWVWFAFSLPAFHTITGLFLCYPISWACITLCHLATALVLAHMEKKKKAASSLAAENA